MYGQLVPIGGGDPIPLLKDQLTIGRRENCDIVLRFGNVSGLHCELVLDRGWWFVKDLNSQNGTRVNGLRVNKKRLDPGDRLTISKHDYEVKYSPSDNGGDEAQPPEDDVFADIMGRSLMESAGLDRKGRQEQEGRIGRRRPAAADAAQEAGRSSTANDNQEELRLAPLTEDGDSEDGDSEDGDSEPPHDNAASSPTDDPTG